MSDKNTNLADSAAVHATWHSTSEGLSEAIEEAEILLTYTARHGIVPGDKTLQILLRSKRLQRTNNWSVDDETRFWLAFDELVEISHPVTPETLASSLPPPETLEEKEERLTNQRKWKKGWRSFLRSFGFGTFRPPISQAREAVQRYRRFAMLSLFMLLSVQIYWVVGSHVVLDVNSLFKDRGEVSNTITRLVSAKGLTGTHIALAEMQDPELKALRDQYKFYDQKLDASYELLQDWNNVWLYVIGRPGFEGKVTPYNSFKFGLEQDRMGAELKALEARLQQTDDIPGGPPSSAERAAANIAQAAEASPQVAEKASTTGTPQLDDSGAVADTPLSSDDAKLAEAVGTELGDMVDTSAPASTTTITVDTTPMDTTPAPRSAAAAPARDPMDTMPAPRGTPINAPVKQQKTLIIPAAAPVPPQPKLSASEEESLKQNAKDIAKEIYHEKLQHEYNKARNRLFLNIAAASFTLEALQAYFLPLLYGLLGACTYVLRQLSIEVKQLTYYRVSEIRYGLRLALGALGGMAISWFVKPDDGSALGSLGPMALAFLTGYNVELLFAIMDKIINSALDSLKTEDEKAMEKQGHLPTQSNPTPLGTVQNTTASIDNVNMPPPGPPPTPTQPRPPVSAGGGGKRPAPNKASGGGGGGAMPKKSE